MPCNFFFAIQTLVLLEIGDQLTTVFKVNLSFDFLVFMVLLMVSITKTKIDMSSPCRIFSPEIR